MTANHDYFEVLCALAASGQLTQIEVAELREHSGRCVFCSNRIAELKELSAQLLLAPAAHQRSRRAPKGMQERFITRAIREGIPLRRRPAKMEMRSLGIAAAIILAVLVIVAAQKGGPLSRSTIETERADGSYIALPVSKENRDSQGVLSNPPPHTMRTSGGSRPRGLPGAAARIPLLGRSTTAPKELLSGDPSARRRYHLIPTAYSENTLIRDYPSSVAIGSTGGVRSSFAGFAPPPMALGAAIGGNPSNLLAECEYCAFNPASFRSNLTFAPLTERGRHGTLDLDAYKPNLKPHFALDPSTFQLIENFVQ